METNTGVKWSCPNIHDLMDILTNVKVDLILDNVFDKRLRKLEKLSVVQLREECSILNLNRYGSKVQLIKRIQMVVGDDAQVSLFYCFLFLFSEVILICVILHFDIYNQ